MESIYLENMGSKGFSMHPLPMPAQYAPVYAITTEDLNQDGKKDIFLAGNNTWTRIKFGRYSANHGILMSGDGRGNFRYVPQPESGLNIRENVRSLQPILIGKNVELICGINDSPVEIIK